MHNLGEKGALGLRACWHLGTLLLLRGEKRDIAYCAARHTAVPGYDLVPAEPTNPQWEPTFHTRTVETAGS